MDYWSVGVREREMKTKRESTAITRNDVGNAQIISPPS